MKFQKKPVVIEAVQWTGDNLLEVIRHTGQHASASHFKWEEYEDLVAREGLKIFTLEGPMMASVGDWIIKGVKGECYPCKPDIFEMTYQAAVQPTTFQERVIAEKSELDEKIVKLRAFLAKPSIMDLPKDERDRLTSQLSCMDGYSSILGQRIAAFA